MALSPGSLLGPYEIQSAAGAGGTGEAYTARDTRLDRTVDIEIVPRHWSQPGRREKFEAEAKIVAGLQHPHIRTLHDIGHERPQAVEGATPESDVEDVDFLVLEHLDGETVADRLAQASAGKRKRAFSVPDAMAIGIQIADALDKAHQQGLVHRGLRPATVFLTKGATKSDPPIAKLLDLGLVEPALTGSAVADAAVAGIAAGGVGMQSVLPTQAPATAQSAVVASVDYLAPEQIEGRAADPRTDVFAFGVLLYEMLTGKRAFEGKSRAVLMAAIMTAEPDPLLAAQPLAPPSLDHVLKRCLAKDPDDRWQTTHDLLLQLRWVSGSGNVAAIAADKRSRRMTQIAVAVASISVAVLATPIAVYLKGSAPPEPFQFRTPVVGFNNTADISVSPDGQRLAFVARPIDQQPASIFVRPVDSLVSQRLGGTDDATQLFWSADSQYIAFVAGGKLRKVEAKGGPPQDITPVDGVSGGTWNEAGTIIFGSAKGLFTVNAEGGKAAPLTTLEKSETGHFWPCFLPDGRHYVYQAWSADSTGRALYIGEVGSKNRTKLMAAETNVAYAGAADNGFLVFHREATVFARPFDVAKLTFIGDNAVQLAGGVAFDPADGRGSFHVSRGDVLVYFQGEGGGGGPVGRGGVAANMQLGWVSRSGPVVAGVGDAATQGDFDLSPDGRLVAVTRTDGGSADIWIIDWQRAGNATKLTLDPGDDIDPVWAPDGNRVAFTTYRKGNADIYLKNANGVGPETPILESPSNEKIEAWSKDGRYIAYLSGNDNFADIYLLPQFGDRKPIPIVEGKYQKNEPQFSDDGKWLAYTSDESGRFEVYVRQVPSGEGKEKISRDGGGQARWRKDGRELFFRALDSEIMTADITIRDGRVEPGVPAILRTNHGNAQMTRDPTRHQLAVTPDGQQLLMRIAPGAVPGGRGRDTVPRAATVFDPSTGQAGGRGNTNFNAGAGLGRGRGPAGGAAGLTVIRHWTPLVSSK
jgi:Tol biopolymer transport system component/serine/threonine protein kinase